jgi:hypothetical protein
MKMIFFSSNSNAGTELDSPRANRVAYLLITYRYENLLVSIPLKQILANRPG